MALRAPDVGARSWALIALLASGALLVVVLAVGAARTAREQRIVAQRVLEDQAASVAWRFGNAYLFNLTGDLLPALIPTSGAPLKPGARLASLDLLRETADSALLCAAPADDSARYYFRLDLRNRSLLTDRPVSAAVRRAVTDTIAATSARAVINWPLFRVVEHPDASRRLLVYSLQVSSAGARVAAYGFETCRSSITPLMPWVYANTRLFPPFQVPETSNDSLIALTVWRTASAETLYASPARYEDGFKGRINSTGVLGLTYEVAIRRELAPRLIIGGLPRSRLPVTFALLAITVVVMAVAVLQLRREQAMARARSDFVAGVSHELRTPLSQILLFGDSLRLGRVSGEEQLSLAAQVISQEARRLIHLVENVLHLSRSDRGTVQLHTTDVPVAPLLRDVVAGYAPLAAPRDAAFEIAADESLAARADADALKQIVLNLVDNAVKFGPVGQRVRISGERGGKSVRIAVEDEGPGIIDARDRERMWLPFVRLSGANGAGGSGIGLAIVRDLVRRQGGQVRHEPREGGGSRFVVELPAAEA